jgi:hypothetical protein
MAPISSQNAETITLPLTEQITDLCDYCVNLTEAMVKYKGWSVFDSGFTTICSQDPGPEICRLCKVVTKQLSTKVQLPATERYNLKPTDWKKASLWMFQNYNGDKRLYGPGSVLPRRICGVTVCGNRYIVWADKGSKQVVPYLSLC